jgi:hypothetical protein
MDPYLESSWGDVHTSLITYARDQLRVQLPPDLRARVEEQVAVQVDFDTESETQRSLRILDTRSGNQVVTAIEFLSLANKSEPVGRTTYRRKQAALLAAGVNLVEIDLLRDGEYVLAVPLHQVPLPYLDPYRICVTRGCRPEEAELYRVSLRDRLPIFRVPLRESDADVLLDLQDLIDRAYEDGGYAHDIDYRVDPQPPLQEDDADWADALLREKGLR